jgi:hypothetical protein
MGYVTDEAYGRFRERFRECIRMLNGLEKTLEKKTPERERRWELAEDLAIYGGNDEAVPPGWPNRVEREE